MTLEGFPERLTKEIKKNKVTDVARKSRINRQTLFCYMNGNACPNVVRLARLCRVLNVSADYLLFGKEN